MSATSGGRWETEEIAGHQCDVYLCSRPNEHGYVLIYLHGVHLGRLQDKPEFIEQFEHYGFSVVCPWTQRSWWTDRICEEFDPQVSAEKHLMERVIPFVEKRFRTEPPGIGLFGTSMGGQGALRFAYKYPDLFPVVVGISPAIDFHNWVAQGDEVLNQMYCDPEDARQDTAVLHIHPLNWPRHQFFCCDPTDAEWFDGADRLRMKLASLGVPFECDLETVGGGHGNEYYCRMANKAVGFLYERLEKERLRVA